MDRAGIFDHDFGVELIDGRIITRMAPIGGEHAWSVGKLNRQLIYCTDGTEYALHVQSTVSLPGDRELQPDLAIYKPNEASHDNPTPEQTLLVVEVSDSSLRYDRTTKMEYYAEAKIPEYWVVDVRNKRVTVYTRPESGTYSSVVQVSGEEKLTACDRAFAVASIF